MVIGNKTTAQGTRATIDQSININQNICDYISDFFTKLGLDKWKQIIKFMVIGNKTTAQGTRTTIDQSINQLINQ
jgi:hypothetical protein